MECQQIPEIDLSLCQLPEPELPIDFPIPSDLPTDFPSSLPWPTSFPTPTPSPVPTPFPLPENRLDKRQGECLGDPVSVD